MEFCLFGVPEFIVRGKITDQLLPMGRKDHLGKGHEETLQGNSAALFLEGIV